MILHVYDVTNSMDEKTNENILAINKVFKDYLVVGGIFHGAVEVYGDEWSYGYCPRGTGVFACAPKENPMYKFRESIVLGPTCKDRKEVESILQTMKREWAGTKYDLLKQNCNHFCEEFCQRLQVGPVPLWVNRFANMGQASLEMYVSVSEQMDQARTAVQSTSQSLYQYFFPPTASGAVAPAPTTTGTHQNGTGAAEPEKAKPFGYALPVFEAVPSQK